MSELFKYLFSYAMGRKALMFVAAAIIIALYIADPSTTKNPHYFFITRMVQEFWIELLAVMCLALSIEFRWFWPKFFLSLKHLETACAYALPRATGAVAVVAVAAIVTLGVTALLAASGVYAKARIWDRIVAFPEYLDARLRDEVRSLSAAHNFPKALALIAQHRALFPESEDHSLKDRELELKDRIEIARQLNARADWLMVRGQMTRDSVQRLRRSYNIYRRPDILDRIGEVNRQVSALLRSISNDEGTCRSADSKKEFQSAFVIKYGWLLLNMDELTDGRKQVDFGRPERPFHVICYLLSKMGDKVERRVHELWDLGI